MSVSDERAAALDRAKVYLGPFLADEGLSGQLLGKQAGAVYDAAVAAIAALERLSQPSDGVTEDEVERVARAIERAQCRGREGPYGGYDYGHNSDFYGPAPEGGRYVIRDFRDSSSPDYGKWVHQTNDHEKHEAAFKQLTEHHIAHAAIAALDHITEEKREEPSEAMSALQDARMTLTKTATGRIGSDELTVSRSFFDSAVRNIDKALVAMRAAAVEAKASPPADS